MRQQKRTSFSSADAFILWHLARQREPANFQVRGCSMLLWGQLRGCSMLLWGQLRGCSVLLLGQLPSCSV